MIANTGKERPKKPKMAPIKTNRRKNVDLILELLFYLKIQLISVSTFLEPAELLVFPVPLTK